MGLSVKTVARDGNCLFRRFRPFVAFEITQNNVQLHINTKEDYELHGVKIQNGGNMDIIAISEIYGVSVGVYFASNGQTTQPLIVMIAQRFLTERIIGPIYFVY
jgi:hypothetical protein